MLGITHLLFVAASLLSHPFYISMTDINHNSKTKTLEVSVRIFTDDFEKTLRKTCNCKVDLTNAADKKGMENLVRNYIITHLQIKLDGYESALQFNGYQKEEESTWSYFEVKNVTNFKSLQIENKLLYDYKEEQINMVHLKSQGKEVTDKLNYPNTKFSITY